MGASGVSARDDKEDASMNRKAAQNPWGAQAKLAEELAALEERAGIRQKVQRVRDWAGPFIPTTLVDDTPCGSDQHEQDYEQDLEQERRDIVWGTRNVYFSVEDIELRKQLMAKFRETENATHSLFRHSVQQAQESCEAAIRRVYVDAALNSVFAVLSGACVGALAGAFLASGGNLRAFVLEGTEVMLAVGSAVIGTVGGAIIGLFLGLYQIDKCRSSRARAVEEAKEVLRDAQATDRDVLNKGFVFKLDEVRTGEPADGTWEAKRRSIQRTEPIASDASMADILASIDAS